jgi:shikimate dehydrogenase
MSAPLSYERFEVSPLDLKNFLDLRRSEKDWLGFNVTVPHKVQVMTLLDSIDVSAQGAQSVNVIQFLRGKLIGHNTDIIGFKNSIAATKNRHSAVVFGSGGAARSVIVALSDLGFKKVFVVGRNQPLSKIGKLDVPISIKEGFWESADLFVNATPLGMSGITDLNFPWVGRSITNPSAVAVDLIYRPSQTPFMNWAGEQGLIEVQNGILMLAEQALSTWEIWLGEMKSRGEVLESTLKLLKRELP